MAQPEFSKSTIKLQIDDRSYWLFLILSLLVQLVLIITLKSTLAVVFITVLVGSIYIYIYYINDFATFLLLLTIVPFVYIEHSFSRYFENIVLQNIPLAFLFLYFIFQLSYTGKGFVVKSHYLIFPIIIYTIISFILSIYGYLRNADTRIIIEELYQNTYFIFAIPIYYLLSKRSNYIFLFKLTIIIFTIIAIQYIIVEMIYPYRFTSYHNHLFPLIVSLLFAGFLFIRGKTMLKLILLLDLIIILWGSFATGTRMLWVSNLVAMIIIFLLYLKSTGYNIKYFIIVLMISIPLLLIFLKPTTRINFDFKNVTTEQRIQSFSDPLADLSFLMRVETVYLSLQEIMQKPLFGYGFGHQLQMKWLLNTKYIFPDNNYLYYWLKGGVIFLFVALWMYYRLFKVQFYLFKKTSSNNVRLMMAALIAGMIALMLFAVMNANLVKLKLNIIYTIIFAYTAYEKNVHEKTYLVRNTNGSAF